MKSLFIVFAALLMNAESFAQQSSYDIETVEVAPKGTRAQQDQDEDLGSMYNGPGEKKKSSSTSIFGTSNDQDDPGTERIAPLSQRTSARTAYEVYGYESVFEMRSRRRVGVGVATSGQMGLLGALAELNFTPENSAVVGFGGGPKYNAFSAQWKHLFGGQVFSPYSSLGYARWYNASGQNSSISKSNPTPLASKFLSENEKRTGEFSVNLFTPSLGLQYNRLVGPYTGTSIFAEIVMLIELESFKQAPLGSLGMLYYF